MNSMNHLLGWMTVGLVAGCSPATLDLGGDNGADGGPGHGSDSAPSPDGSSAADSYGSGTGSGSSPDSGTSPGVDSGASSEAGSGASGRLILFGGSNVSSALGETWAWDGSSWTQLKVTGPSERDSSIGGKVGNNIVLFGGEEGSLSDTWIWNGSAWTASSATGPTGTEGNVASSLGSSLVLFYTDQAGNGNTWSFGGSSWKLLSSESGPFQGLGWTATTFMSAVSLFGNGSEWTLDGSFWNQSSMVEGGPNNTSPSAALNCAPLGNVLVVFNGEGDGFGDVNETWTWDGSNWTLHNVVNGPSARSYASMATYQNTVVLFGGCDYGFDGVVGGTTCLGDTWTWDGTSWTEHQVPGPSPRAHAFLVAE